MVPAFRLRGITLGYHGNAVLESGDLEIPAGKVTCVIGPSGTGKSTLLESIGLMSDTFLPTTDSASLFEVEGERLDPHTLWSKDRERLSAIRRDRFSFIFQSTNLMPNFTIGENIRVAARTAPGDNGLEERLLGLLDMMRLPKGILDKPAHAVSGGQKQRIAFIRALVKDFSILLADEPTGNLDPENSVALFRTLKENLAGRHRTAVIVTHHLDLAAEFGDMVLTIQPGQDGPARVTIHKAPTAV